MSLNKPWFTSKTVWVNLLGATAVLIGMILNSKDNLGIPAEWFGAFAIIQHWVNLLLRFSSHTSITGSNPEPGA